MQSRQPMTPSYRVLRTVFVNRNRGVILHAVLQAIMKESYMDAFPGMVWKNQAVPNMFYHVEGKRHSDRLEEGEAFYVVFFFCGIPEETVGKFTEALKQRMSIPENRNYYTLEYVFEPFEKRLEDLREEYSFIPYEGTVKLDFVMPLPFKPCEESGTVFTKEMFAKSLLSRMKRLFGDEILCEIDTDAFEIFTDFGKITLCTHQVNGRYGQRIQGCVGTLTLKGDISSFRDLLILACELHLGNELTTSQGYFFVSCDDYSGFRDDEGDEPYKKPLYVTEMNSFLGTSGGALEVYCDKELKESYPLNRVGEVIVGERSIFSTDFLKKCCDRHIPVSLFLGKSDEFGFFVSPDKRSYDLIGQHYAKFHALSDSEIVGIAKEIAAAKIVSFKSLFAKKWKEGTASVIKELDQAAASFEKAETVDEVLGFEGSATRFIHSAIQPLILNPDFRFERRGRFENDLMNSTLNYAYSLLFRKVVLILMSLGLNPYLGFLHSSNDRYESLACDIEEPFRAVVFNAVISAVNHHFLQSSDFVESADRMVIKKSGIQAITLAFEREFQRKDRNSGKTILEELFNQCMTVKRWAAGKGKLAWYRWE